MTLKHSEDQVYAIEAIRAWKADKKRKQIFTLAGLAGTGKTTIIKAVLPDLGNAAVCAFSGKAVNVLRQKGIYHAQTIHSLIYEFDGKRFSRRNFLDCNLIVVDEASMLSTELLEDLRAFNLPMLCVGDHGQLEPVGDDPQLMLKADIKLEHIHRQAEGNPIIGIAHAVREGYDPIESIMLNGGSTVTLTHIDDLIDRNKKFHQVLCAYNNQRVRLNDDIRIARGFSDPLHLGEKLICLRNDYDFGVFNGQQAVVSSLSPLSLTLDDGRELKMPPLDMNTLASGKPPEFGSYSDDLHFTYGYAITVHKAQGSEWPKVAIVSGQGKAWDMKRWNYTALTRASEKVVWI